MLTFSEISGLWGWDRNEGAEFKKGKIQSGSRSIKQFDYMNDLERLPRQRKQVKIKSYNNAEDTYLCLKTKRKILHFKKVKMHITFISCQFSKN